MKRYEIVGTTADVGIIAYGCSMKALFENATAGMFSVIFGAEPKSLLVDKTESIALSAVDLETLLVSWLSELLWYFDAESVAPTSYRVKIVEPAGEDASVIVNDEVHAGVSLEAEVGFVSLSDCDLFPTTDVKAVTMHGLEIKAAEGVLSARIIFDI